MAVWESFTKLCIQSSAGTGLKGWTGWRFTVPTQWANQDVSPHFFFFFKKNTLPNFELKWNHHIVGLCCEENNQKTSLYYWLLMSHSVTQGKLVTPSLSTTPHINWRKRKDNQYPSPHPLLLPSVLKYWDGKNVLEYSGSGQVKTIMHRKILPLLLVYYKLKEESNNLSPSLWREGKRQHCWN